MSKVAAVYQHAFQAQKSPPMSTKIHQHPLLSTGFAVKVDREEAVLEGLAQILTS